MIPFSFIDRQNLSDRLRDTRRPAGLFVDVPSLIPQNRLPITAGLPRLPYRASLLALERFRP